MEEYGKIKDEVNEEWKRENDMATLKDVAKKCNVSIATVSNILSGKPNAGEETRKKVLEAVRELDYTPNYVAKNLKMKSTKTIGIIVEDITVFCAPGIIDGITQYSEEVGYHILLTNLRLYKKYNDIYYQNDKFSNIVHREIKELISKQVDGIIYIASHERILKCFPEQLSVPAVMAYGYTKSAKIPSVVVNDVDGAYQIASYVVEQGHTKIGIIAGKENSIHMSERLVGYQRAMFEHNVLYNPDYVVHGDWTRESGYKAACKLLEKDITAILCMNDDMAGGVYDRLEELGLIPGRDISVTGYDNREIAGFYYPGLTTLELPLFEIGRTACKQVIDLIRQDADEKREEELGEIEVKGKVIVRKSVKIKEN